MFNFILPSILKLMKTAMYQVDLNFKADLNRAKRFLILFFFFLQCILEHVELSMSYYEH